MRITVAQSTVRTLEGVSTKTGKPYKMRFQAGYAYTVDADGNQPPFPEKFEIMLDDSTPHGYAPGEYTLHPSAIHVDRNGRLAVATRLTPARVAAKV